MIQCPICQENLVRSEGEVNNLLHKLLAVSKKPDIEQLLHAIRFEAESDSEDSEDEHDLFYLTPNLPNPTRVQRFLNHLQRPSQMADYVKRFYAKMVAVKCGHCFHFSCLQQWCYIRKTNAGPSSTCPMCRERFTLGEALSVFFTLAPNADLEAVEMNSVELTSGGGGGSQILLRWQRQAVQMFQTWNKEVLTRGKIKFCSKMSSINGIVEKVLPAPTTAVRYGIPAIVYVIFFIRLCFLKHFTSYNYEIADAADEIEDEIRFESGQFLGYGFAMELFALCVFCAAIDFVCYVFQK